MIYYISDLHFGHKNILHLSNRPFANVDEMDKKIIKKWNSRVKDEDTVYILGDICFRNGKDASWYLKQLKGKKHLIIGNHDNHLLKNKENFKYFETITPLTAAFDNGDKIILCHYPMVEWDGFYRNALHFYGHIHNNVTNDTYKIISKVPNAYNVGADILDFTPRTKLEVIEFNKKFQAEHK